MFNLGDATVDYKEKAKRLERELVNERKTSGELQKKLSIAEIKIKDMQNERAPMLEEVSSLNNSTAHFKRQMESSDGKVKQLQFEVDDRAQIGERGFTIKRQKEDIKKLEALARESGGLSLPQMSAHVEELERKLTGEKQEVMGEESTICGLKCEVLQKQNQLNELETRHRCLQKNSARLYSLNDQASANFAAMLDLYDRSLTKASELLLENEMLKQMKMQTTPKGTDVDPANTTFQRCHSDTTEANTMTASCDMPTDSTSTDMTHLKNLQKESVRIEEENVIEPIHLECSDLLAKDGSSGRVEEGSSTAPIQEMEEKEKVDLGGIQDDDDSPAIKKQKLSPAS